MTKKEVSKQVTSQQEREKTVPLMLRPKLSQKACVELLAEQIGTKRSQLDSTFYLLGALLTGIERLGKEEMIGTWTRKEVAVLLKPLLTPLFELLYEQDELPLVFSLLIARSGTPVVPVPAEPSLPSVQRSTGPLPPVLPSGSNLTAEQQPAMGAATYLPMFNEEAEMGLDGFPDEI